MSDKLKQREIWRRASAKYRATAKGVETVRKSSASRRKRRPEAYLAHMWVARATRDGRLVKPDFCSVGDECYGRIEGHHDDYSKPLDVVWLCIKHHSEVHNG